MDRRVVHIINPASGGGRKFKTVRDAIRSLGEELYITTKNGDAEDFVASLTAKDPTVHIVAHGGDGTMCEAVSGIMKSGAGATSLFSGVAVGSGNDFLRYMTEEKCGEGSIFPTDVIRVGDLYSVNVLNIGFDCTVVVEAERARRAPFVGNSFSYILGVVGALFRKEAFTTEVTLRDVLLPDGTTKDEVLPRGDYLLAAVANGRYYGGGFKVAPRADSSDGFLDVILVKNVSVPKFAALVSGFRKGTHIEEDLSVKKKYGDVMLFRRCRGIKLDGIERICRDGEISDASSVDAEIIKGAISYTPARREWLL
ncbi:MAG: hypothetical protein IJQ80_02920 [Clostridia bacterium]|nr:hypothetical protein [Clostridia bacterium]